MSYFKVGEECILQSESWPSLNGNCVVIGVLPDIERKGHLPSGQWQTSGGCAYHTTIKNPKGWPWSESALRKKHKPSTESLSTMIEELNKVKA
jgi:hypothetical protein